jgi:glutamate-1-semialdehyde 2,1-aminomutase
MNTSKSQTAFSAACGVLPGGVNSPVRSFKSIDGKPVFIDRALGARLWDIDGNEYIDYVGSWGPMILGHAHPDVLQALQPVMQKGTSFGAPTLLETDMARIIIDMVPSIEMVRMVNSGTEATLSALRLARGYTGRNLFIKFEGCYHGHGDSFLIQAGSGALTLSTPNSPGVTPANAKDTLIAGYNDLDSVQALFEQYPNDIAGVILEPVPGNMGVIIPQAGFLEGVRELCTSYGALLIFDEVMSGFRLAPGGAQELYKVQPDLTTLGKIIGGGLPVGAYGGKREIMEHVAPAGPVYQAGTLSGNPLAMTAGYTTLKIISEQKDFYTRLEEKSARLENGLKDILAQLGFPGVVNRVGSMFTLFFTREEAVVSFADVEKCNFQQFALFFTLSLKSGIYLAPSQYEAGFVSTAHSDNDIQTTLENSRQAIEQVKKHANKNK